MSSAAAVLPCQLSAQVLGRDRLRGVAKNRLKPRQVQRHVFRCFGGLSVIRKVGDRLRQGDTTAQEILSMHLDKILVTDQAIGSFVSHQIDAALLEVSFRTSFSSFQGDQMYSRLTGQTDRRAALSGTRSWTSCWHSFWNKGQYLCIKCAIDGRYGFTVLLSKIR